MDIFIWKTYHLNDATLLFGSKWTKNPQLRFPKNEILIEKKILVTFYCYFFRFFFQKLSKSKGH